MNRRATFRHWLLLAAGVCSAATCGLWRAFMPEPLDVGSLRIELARLQQTTAAPRTPPIVTTGSSVPHGWQVERIDGQRIRLTPNTPDRIAWRELEAAITAADATALHSFTIRTTGSRYTRKFQTIELILNSPPS